MRVFLSLLLLPVLGLAVNKVYNECFTCRIAVVAYRYAPETYRKDKRQLQEDICNTVQKLSENSRMTNICREIFNEVNRNQLDWEIMKLNPSLDAKSLKFCRTELSRNYCKGDYRL